MIDMKLKRWLFGILVISVIVITALAANVDATSVNDFYFSNFNADYYLSRAENGTSRLHVKEILTAEFAEDNLNHGIIRVIPRTNQNGANQVVSSEDSLNLMVLRNGNPENIQKIEDNADSYSVYIGNPDEYLTGTQVYTLEYDFNDVITEFAADGSNVSGREDATKAWQELYWDTNGAGWSQPFDKVTANLHLADEIKDRVSAETDCYVGKYGSNSGARCQTTKTADGFSFSAQNLGVGENLTFVTKFDPDTFVVILEKNYVPLIVLLVELVGGGALVTYFVRRWFKKAKPQEDAYKKAFVAPRRTIDDAVNYLNRATAIQPKGIYYYLLAYIKYDYFERKFLNTTPNYKQLLKTAAEKGVTTAEINNLYSVLGVQRPSCL